MFKSVAKLRCWGTNQNNKSKHLNSWNSCYDAVQNILFSLLSRLKLREGAKQNIWINKRGSKGKVEKLHSSKFCNLYFYQININ